MTESEHTADYQFLILSERAVYDEIMNETYQGCTSPQGQLFRCVSCPPIRRVNCSKPKTWSERYPDWEGRSKT